MAKKPGRLCGKMPCEGCNNEIEVREATSGFLYYSCPKPCDGGCGRQTFSRDTKSSHGMALKMTLWRSPEARAKHLTGDEVPVTAAANDNKETVVPDAANDNAQDPAKEKTSFWNTPL